MPFMKKNSLLFSAEKEFDDMLKLGSQMFDIAIAPVGKDVSPVQSMNFHEMDKNMNKRHRQVRRMLFEHLSFSGGNDLFPSLVLLSVVDDSERIGDLTKNLAELLASLPNELHFGKFISDVQEITDITRKSFSRTLDAFARQDEALAEKIVTEYKATSNKCDGIMNAVLALKDEKVHCDCVALALLVRYMKRINAHLKNIASSVVNPYHRIGYKVKKQDG